MKSPPATSTPLSQRYFKHFKPLITEFLNDVRPPNVNGAPGISLPLFGEKYESSALKLVFIGLDDANTFVDLKDYFDKPDPLETAVNRFHNFGADRKGVFWGFVMRVLASLHGGKTDLNKMKTGETPEILSSFAWSNVNPITHYNNGAKRLGIEKKYWESVCKSGKRLFYGFKHIRETLTPKAAVIMCKNCNIDSYVRKDYPGILKEISEPVDREVKEKKLLTHYVLNLPNESVHIFHTPHPRYMRSLSSVGGENYFCNKLTELISKLKSKVT